jgi:hypothetical protein
MRMHYGLLINFNKDMIWDANRLWASLWLRASSVVLSMWPRKNILSHPSLVIYFFPTSAIRLKLGLQTGGRLLIATPPGPIKLSSQSIAGVRLCCAFYQLSKLCKNPGPKPFCWAKLACMDFSSANFNMQGHILSTSGVALTLAICEHYTLHTHP